VILQLLFRIDRLLARPRLVLQTFKAMVGIAMPPKADDPWLDPNFPGDRPRAASGRRQKNYPRPLQIALQRYRRATARLKHLAIFPRKVDFSRFGYHPYLESRLTIQEKWVLVLALQLQVATSSESIGHHDSGPDDWWRVS
jgi:hypothetical protein